MIKGGTLSLFIAAFFCTSQTAWCQTPTTQYDSCPAPLVDFIKQSNLYLKLRYRVETVDQASFAKDSNASTLRTALGFKSPQLYGLKGHFEIEDVSEIGPNNFNNTINGVSDRPVIADVDGTELNILTLTSDHIPSLSVLVGRYQKVLDNARFIGDVAWRQNQQTFDGATLTGQSIENVELFYGYMWNVNRIFGDDSPVGDVESDNHIFNIGFKGIKDTKVSLYSYLLDLEELQTQSSLTVGASVAGRYRTETQLDLLYDLEYAHQNDAHDNPVNYNAAYYRVGTGLGYQEFSLLGGVELLGSDNGRIAVSTPLATLHKWNGWADIFTNTPAEGLYDYNGRFQYRSKQWNESLGETTFEIEYHYFTADQGSTTWGNEWDFNVVQTFLEKYNLGVKLARYNANQFGSDTTKLIFTLSTEFTTG